MSKQEDPQMGIEQYRSLGIPETPTGSVYGTSIPTIREPVLHEGQWTNWGEVKTWGKKRELKNNGGTVKTQKKEINGGDTEDEYWRIPILHTTRCRNQSISDRKYNQRQSNMQTTGKQTTNGRRTKDIQPTVPTGNMERSFAERWRHTMGLAGQKHAYSTRRNVSNGNPRTAEDTE